ncbi:MAG: glycerophosphodiester phosphodiesterase [Magnetococcales bacterium]|nr:glycerophosphodiester phosphodiesterase [Magnetococcales bacterium]MBF0149886.1 glycerophosphodiester phosphodiesterase [Magnetococcales bacterium]MBF0174177.1 glycerophosphodiester phosphodiesterase [Magnetococcales bacterium]MBF0346540.1 glycerophosphodiester phosphodiesterase [Magnetococcales bacterium]MBF0631868.1 glycerophosphodiester phosphodiesterase [Magnetococcales bacterium]
MTCWHKGGDLNDYEQRNLLHWLLDPTPDPRHLWVTERPIAHRGWFDVSQGIPENSMAAFQRALDHQYHMELDVRLLADGQPVVFHDHDLERMTGERGLVANLTTAQWRKLRLRHDHHPPPLLREVFELTADKGGILVELKDPSPRAAQAVVTAAAGHRGPWAALSFHAGIISWFARHHPHITRGLNGGVFEQEVSPLASWEMRTFLHAPGARPHFLGCYLHSLNNPLPRWLRFRGLPIIAWTARSAEDWHRTRHIRDAMIFEGNVPRPP